MNFPLIIQITACLMLLLFVTYIGVHSFMNRFVFKFLPLVVAFALGFVALGAIK